MAVKVPYHESEKNSSHMNMWCHEVIMGEIKGDTQIHNANLCHTKSL